MGMLGKLFGGKSNAAKSMSLEEALNIVGDFGDLMVSASKPPGSVDDVKRLPHPKERIKAALMVALHGVEDAKLREPLKIALMELAFWQPGVGDTPIGMPTGPTETDEELRALARRMTESAAEVARWTKMANEEASRNLAEAKDAGF